MAVDMGFDESGSKDILLVSAQVGVVQKARTMNSAWKSILREAKVPFFHSVDYDNFSKGVFRHLKRPDRKELLELLCGHIRKRMLFGLTGKITISNYNAKTTNKFRSQWSSAYGFAISILMLKTRTLMDELRLGDEVNVVIEEGHPNAAQMIEVLKRMKLARERGSSEPALYVMNYGLGAKKDYPILQAADMLAYSEWQRFIQGNREIFEQLHVDGSRYKCAYMDLDKYVVDPALEVAQRSDEARAILQRAEWHNRTKRTDGIDETVRRIREFRQKHAEVSD